MASPPTSYRSGLSRARGLGSAHHGVGEFIAERVTSVALAPLSLWAVWAVIAVGHGGYAGAVAFLQSPVQAVLAVLFLGVSFHHMHLGMRVIVEDYIHDNRRKIMLLLLNAGMCLLGAALAVFAVLKVAFAGGVAH